MNYHITNLFQPRSYGRCASQIEGASISTLPESSSVVSMQSGFGDPSEEDLEERLENLRDTRIRLEIQLPALARVSSEEDLLSTDMSLAGSMEDIYGTPSPLAPFDHGCKETIAEDSGMLLIPGEMVELKS